jgi:hypothetical protein
MILKIFNYGWSTGFDFDYYRILLDDVRSFRTRFPSDAVVMAGDFNIELFNPVGPDERLVDELLWGCFLVILEDRDSRDGMTRVGKYF